MKRALALLVLGTSSILSSLSASAEVPEPFRESTPTSTYSISYEDLSAFLRTTVVNMGRSSRDSTGPVHAPTGTRLSSASGSKTDDEGNRFYFEAFEDNDDNRRILHELRLSLEAIPGDAPLKYFSRDEQLAYWLNLYNVTLLDELVSIYPKRSLKKVVAGSKSVLDDKILNVAGIPLSLNDIQFTILKENYDNNPLVIYGLYQGIIGGPNIRKRAYQADDVWSDLVDNAEEFVNSNRGTQSQNERVFKVSSLYDRAEAYFPDFEADLRDHLMRYIRGQERRDLEVASEIKPKIDDWSMTDLYGSRAKAGGSLATNPAALLDSMSTLHAKDFGGGSYAAAQGATSSTLASYGILAQRIDPELVNRLRALNDKREQVLEENSIISVEEIDKPE